MTERLYIVGASVRAAAFSALRGGLAPVAVDCFADLDLIDRCRAIRVDAYPAGILDALATEPTGPWMYTGAIENYRGLVGELSRRMPLRGNPAEVLEQVRDPWRVAEILRSGGFAFPALRRGDQPAPNGQWVVKRRASSSGTHVRRYGTHQHPLPDVDPDNDYLQQYIDGRSYSAVFLSSGADAALVGVTRQWVGLEAFGSRAFQYAGSIGPIHRPLLQERILPIGRTLAAAFGLRGIFGIDFVWDGREAWPVEINPRYTASCELLERACGSSLVAEHLAACAGELKVVRPRPRMRQCFGKLILFARRATVVPDNVPHRMVARQRREPWPAVADIPPPGQRIEAGQPVLTVFAAADTGRGVREQLVRRARNVQRILRC